MIRIPRPPFLRTRRGPINADLPQAEEPPKPADERRRVPVLAVATGAVILVVALLGVLVSTNVIDLDGEAAEPVSIEIETATLPDSPLAEGSELEYPVLATRNTTRIGSTDSIVNAASAALAIRPQGGQDDTAPENVVVSSNADWQAVLASAVLHADPVDAPLLMATPQEVPLPTESALGALDPERIIPIGELPELGQAATAPVTGESTAELVVEIAQLRDRMAGEPPDSILLVSSTEPPVAAAAAGWAAHAGDPLMFMSGSELPRAVSKYLESHPETPIQIVTGSDLDVDEVEIPGEEQREIELIQGEGPVEAAIEFARFESGELGWGIDDPGHGFALMHVDRALDAPTAAQISASAAWGPVLLTDRSSELPDALEAYLLDIKPGYRTDPTRALYNRVWIIGDPGAIEPGQQATIDELAQLERIGEDS